MSDTAPQKKKGWLARLSAGLGRSSRKLGDGISGLFTRTRLDQDTLDELEELLIGADLGAPVAARFTAELARGRIGKDVTSEEVRALLADAIAKVLEPLAVPLDVARGHRPHVVLVVGVNGTGKTTTIGKLAKQWRHAGTSVLMVAGDTFRAAAIEQLKIWGERAGTPVMAGAQGADAAGLAYDAVARARADGTDVVLIDTAGRLQNQAGLMAELEKIVRVLRKLDATAPHDVLLVLDATTGQNAHSQVELFTKAAEVSGLIVTKLDGTARGGVVVALAERFGLPVHAIGVGESADDLQPFTAEAFARGLVGLGETSESPSPELTS